MVTHATAGVLGSTQRTGQQPTQKVGQGTTASTTSKPKDLGSADFMQLLVAELQNQDPMNPTSDKDFIAQMAQFSSLQQLQSLTETLTKGQSIQSATQAAALLGRHVDASVTDSKTGQSHPVSGLVNEVRMEKSGPMLVVNGQEIDFSTVTRVY